VQVVINNGVKLINFLSIIKNYGEKFFVSEHWSFPYIKSLDHIIRSLKYLTIVNHINLIAIIKYKINYVSIIILHVGVWFIQS
jgi:hypothetical protein